MNVIVLSASPNVDGLTAACAAAAVEGARRAGAQVQEVRLNDA
jgi:multimeric flavodoxin WrbA